MRGRRRPKVEASWPATLRELISQCWANNPIERPSWGRVLQLLNYITAEADADTDAAMVVEGATRKNASNRDGTASVQPVLTKRGEKERRSSEPGTQNNSHPMLRPRQLTPIQRKLFDYQRWDEESSDEEKLRDSGTWIGKVGYSKLVPQIQSPIRRIFCSAKESASLFSI